MNAETTCSQVATIPTESTQKPEPTIVYGRDLFSGWNTTNPTVARRTSANICFVASWFTLLRKLRCFFRRTQNDFGSPPRRVNSNWIPESGYVRGGAADQATGNTLRP